MALGPADSLARTLACSANPKLAVHGIEPQGFACLSFTTLQAHAVPSSKAHMLFCKVAGAEQPEKRSVPEAQASYARLAPRLSAVLPGQRSI